MREKNDVRGVLGVLEVCVRGNFAGTESARLYSEVRQGSLIVCHQLNVCRVSGVPRT